MKNKNNKSNIPPIFIKIDSILTFNPNFSLNENDNYNRENKESLIYAKNDIEAIITFLKEYTDSQLTYLAYAKEIERLLLWCIHVGKINISSLRRNHLVEYQQFLKDPIPKHLWCGAKVSRQLKNGSINPDWRPFGADTLSASTINKTITILDSFFNYLVQTNFLTGNPLAVERRRKKRNKGPSKIIDRYLELDELHAVLLALSNKIQDKDQAFQIVRARYIVLLFFYTGLRIAEAANHTMGNYIQREGNWFLRIIGKGKKLREIPIPDELLDTLADFRLKVGLTTPEPQFNEMTPLIPMQNLKDTISARRINQILKSVFNLGSLELEHSHPRKASKLKQASAHWLRHSYVTYLLNAGAPLKVVQDNAGHSDISTTMRYRHVAQTDRHEATRHLSIANNKININKVKA